MTLTGLVDKFLRQITEESGFAPLASMETRIVKRFAMWVEARYAYVILVPKGKALECPICGVKLKAPEEEFDEKRGI